MKKVTILTGHYGVGKTNIAVNMALKLANNNEKVSIVDLDTVNPYFRTADLEKLFLENNITLIKSIYANTNLDIPAISFDLERIVSDDGYIIIDVGGDDAGATALGRFSHFLKDADMLYVINCYRLLTGNAKATLEVMEKIEKTSRMQHTGIINNSNLGIETTADTIYKSMDFAKEVAELADLPIYWTTVKERIFSAEEKTKNNIEEVSVYVKLPWY